MAFPSAKAALLATAANSHFTRGASRGKRAWSAAALSVQVGLDPGHEVGVAFQALVDLRIAVLREHEDPLKRGRLSKVHLPEAASEKAALSQANEGRFGH